MAVEYNGTTDKADTGYSSGVKDLNIFYDVSLSIQCLLRIAPLTALIRLET